MFGGNRLWRQADFLKLWVGQTISVVGSEVTVIALPTIAILQLHATAAEVGLLAAAQQIAFPVLALFAGVVADRLRRRPMMILADCLRAIAILSVPIAPGVGVLGLLPRYVVRVGVALGAARSNPAGAPPHADHRWPRISPTGPGAVSFRLPQRPSDPWPGRHRLWRRRRWGSRRSDGGRSCGAPAWCRKFPGSHQCAPRARIPRLAAGAPHL